MKIQHWMRREDSGLVRSTLEIAQWEERLGHDVCIREPSAENSKVLYGTNGSPPDIHSIHSQIHPSAYHDGRPKIMWMHGEPLSSVGNRVSMRAIVDLATRCDAFICMREDEQVIWNSIKRTHRVRKGIDLEVYRPLEGIEKLSGEPAVLYCENWRGDRNPLYACIAMQLVHEQLPGARLHLYNCQDPKMHDTFRSLYTHNKWWTFLRSLQGPAEDITNLYNQADIVVSCLYPLYARSIEAFGCGKPLICPGYRENNYPWQCELEPRSMADAIIRCWENRDKMDYRKYAEQHHDAKDMVAEALEIYGRYL